MGVPATHADAETVYLKIYGSFMEGLDAIDNGEGHALVLSAHTFCMQPDNQARATSLLDSRLGSLRLPSSSSSVKL